jgi:hypothetical protein
MKRKRIKVGRDGTGKCVRSKRETEEERNKNSGTHALRIISMI